ncbi:MAG: HRDC domain-containing protein [Thermodesulfobacteriota bacterium]
MTDQHLSYEWIETFPHLEEVARILRQAEIIGVDLEADSLYHYFEKVCLLQISTESASYVLDPLALRDLSLLQPIFTDSGIRKVFHGADYDIRSLFRDFQLEVQNLFDTQLACQFLGLRETGLDAVLRTRFQIELNKKFQRADWSRRPLPSNMVEYAASDGRYLIPLARLLEKELKEKGRLSWVEEECQWLTRVRFLPPGSNPLFQKIKGAAHLDPRGLAVLESLLRFRETLARKADIPPFKVFGNEPLLELAVKKPLTMEELEKGTTLSRKQIDRYALDLIREIHRAMALPPSALPLFRKQARPLLPGTVNNRIKDLKHWRQRRAKDLIMDPGILINNATIIALAKKNPSSPEVMKEVPGMKKWLIDQFGLEILATLKRGWRELEEKGSKNIGE